jgi:hypothetical protein
LPPGPLNLLLSYDDVSVDVMSKLPSVVRPFVQGTPIGTSGVQSLSAADMSILCDVYNTLKGDAGACSCCQA